MGTEACSTGRESNRIRGVAQAARRAAKFSNVALAGYYPLALWGNDHKGGGRSHDGRV
eukprot:CAMPEP_0117686398 /NCGR_PEP_ID=MMETSP0804-20121206/22423_1 /TAXON_ID=1074897 /ORGANISM="Tetraselmis astigmatica, Strain CCMP880" /LENGTH=57 /DNA_ID=CAMNT_0005498077 /DNA_START=17 /DNA_END=190 /DNA_ORIENTATION=-